MYLYPLDKVTHDILSKRSNFNLFSLSNESSRSGIIQNLLVENLLNKKTSIVLVPTLEQAQYVKQCLTEANLDQLSITISDKKEINDKDQAYLRSTAKTTRDNSNLTEFEILKTNANKAINNLKESYDLLNKKIFGERSWRALSSQKEHFNYHSEVNLVKRKIDINQIEFTQKEYWNIRGRVEEASNNYVSKFSILQKVDCLSPNLYKVDHLNDKVVKLEKLLNKGNNLLMSFGNLIEVISSNFKEQGLEELEQLSAMNAAVSHSLTEYIKRNAPDQTSKGLQGKLKKVFSQSSKATGITSLQQQVKFLYDEFSESKFFDLNIPQYQHDKINEAGIKEICDKATKILDNWQTHIQSYADTKLKQMSPLNSEHHELNRLDKALSDYLTEINAAEILNDVVEDNTFSLYKKLDLLETTLEKLRTGFAILTENEDYIEWMSMLAYCKTGTSSIIKALMGLPIMHWTRIFDQIFIGDLLDRNLSPRLPKNEVQLDHIDEISAQHRSLIKDAIKAKWNIEKEAALTQLKKENKQLYTTIVKKNNSLDLNWQKLITQAPETISALFPIMIVTEAAASTIKPLYYKWSECISYNWSQLDDPGLLQIKGFSLKQSVLEEATVSKDLERKLKSYFNSIHIEAKALVGDTLGEVRSTFSLMDNREKLSKAKSLSKILLNSNPNIRLFYLKNGCLISTLSDKDNSRIVELLAETGIKEVSQIHELEDTLNDMFVDTSKQCTILLEDGLLNTADIECFDWQYHTIKNLRTLGYQVINMWTADMPSSDKSLINTLLSQKEEDLSSQELTLFSSDLVSV